MALRAGSVPCCFIRALDHLVGEHTSPTLTVTMMLDKVFKADKHNGDFKDW
jgi:hypothetical protein